MSKTKIMNFIEDTFSDLPGRMSGNEANDLVVKKLRQIAINERAELIGALRTYLSFRITPTERRPDHAVQEGRLWFALDAAKQLQLSELKPDIESLLVAVRSGKVLLPIHESAVARYTQHFSKN